jgi:hypothetical protein
MPSEKIGSMQLKDGKPCIILTKNFFESNKGEILELCQGDFEEVNNDKPKNGTHILSFKRSEDAASSALDIGEHFEVFIGVPKKYALKVIATCQ